MYPSVGMRSGPRTSTRNSSRSSPRSSPRTRRNPVEEPRPRFITSPHHALQTAQNLFSLGFQGVGPGEIGFGPDREPSDLLVRRKTPVGPPYDFLGVLALFHKQHRMYLHLLAFVAHTEHQGISGPGIGLQQLL